MGYLRKYGGSWETVYIVLVCVRLLLEVKTTIENGVRLRTVVRRRGIEGEGRKRGIIRDTLFFTVSFRFIDY